MKKVGIVIGLCVVLAFIGGCSTVRKSYAPDGREAFSLNCSGLARGWDKCLASAGELCGARGYDVLDRSSEEAAAISGTRFGISGARTQERSMLIACKKPL